MFGSKSLMKQWKDFTNQHEYIPALRMVLKYEIQSLLHRLSETGEESVLVTASLSDDSHSVLASGHGERFIHEPHGGILSTFMENFVLYCKYGANRKDSTSMSKKDGKLQCHLTDQEFQIVVEESDVSGNPDQIYKFISGQSPSVSDIDTYQLTAGSSISTQQVGQSDRKHGNGVSSDTEYDTETMKHFKRNKTPTDSSIDETVSTLVKNIFQEARKREQQNHESSLALPYYCSGRRKRLGKYHGNFVRNSPGAKPKFMLYPELKQRLCSEPYLDHNPGPSQQNISAHINGTVIEIKSEPELDGSYGQMCVDNTECADNSEENILQQLLNESSQSEIESEAHHAFQAENSHQISKIAIEHCEKAEVIDDIPNSAVMQMRDNQRSNDNAETKADTEQKYVIMDTKEDNQSEYANETNGNNAARLVDVTESKEANAGCKIKDSGIIDYLAARKKTSLEVDFGQCSVKIERDDDICIDEMPLIGEMYEHRDDQFKNVHLTKQEDLEVLEGRSLYKLSKTRAGKLNLVHNGYTFIRDKRGRYGTVYWKCGRTKCKARVIQKSHEMICTQDHNHVPNSK